MSQSQASHEDLVDLAETLQPCTAQGPHQQQETVEHEVHIEHQWFHQSGPSQVSLHWRRDSQVAGYNNGGCDKQKAQGHKALQWGTWAICCNSVSSRIFALTQKISKNDHGQCEGMRS